MLDFVSDAVYVDLKYDDVFVLWLIVVCEWVGGGLFVMGSCVVCAWCSCYVLCGCMNGASPVRFVCVSRRARIRLDVPRFCEEQSQPGGRERRPACPKKRNRAPISGAGIV